MTKKEVEAEFRESVFPSVLKQEKASGSGKLDDPLRAMAWTEFTEGLARDGKISEHQRVTWVHPTWLFTATNRY